MLNENAKKWVAALRSGKYKQGRGVLCRNGQYCCLGVACEVAEENGVPLIVRVEEDFTISFDGKTRNLPEGVQSWLGLQNSVGGMVARNRDEHSLTQMNDSAYFSFDQIADIIESEPEGLFV